MNEWIPVIKKLPDTSRRVIATLKNGMVLQVFFINDKFKFICPGKNEWLEEVLPGNPVMAWMELPTPHND